MVVGRICHVVDFDTSNEIYSFAGLLGMGEREDLGHGGSLGTALRF